MEGGLVFWRSPNCIKAFVQAQSLGSRCLTHAQGSLYQMWINSSTFLLWWLPWRKVKRLPLFTPYLFLATARGYMEFAPPLPQLSIFESSPPTLNLAAKPTGSEHWRGFLNKVITRLLYKGDATDYSSPKSCLQQQKLLLPKLNSALFSLYMV